jgi:hypothetical protein
MNNMVKGQKVEVKLIDGWEEFYKRQAIVENFDTYTGTYLVKFECGGEMILHPDELKTL